MPSGECRFLRVKYLIYNILYSIGCGLRLKVPGCRGVCRPACFPSCRGGRTTGPSGVRVFLRSQRKGGRKGGSIRRVPVRRRPCSSSDGSRQARPEECPAGGSPSSDPERANEKILSGHGDMGRRVDGKSTVPPFRTTALDSAKGADPLEYAVIYRKTTVSDMAVRMAAYRRIGSPRICVWENRDRGGRLFYPSEETADSRDGMPLHASLPAARWREREAIRCDTTRR